jgi:probable blue pigment (indigoidine) exporter
MEGKWTTSALTAIAPVAWGSNYVVTSELLPADRPLFGAAMRALPAGLLLLAVTRRLPHGDWWWRALVLGTLNVGAFFVLVFVAAERLPSGVAATMMATSPAVMMLLAWPLVGERPRTFGLAGAAVGFLGVALLVLRAGQPLDPAGLAASLSAMVLSSVGFILGKRWQPPVSVLTFTAWQLLAGGLVLAPVALLVEGRPPHIGGPAVLGFLYVGLVATVLAYVVWFRGLQLLPAGTVGLIGLFNPVAGVALGVAVAGEAFGPVQGLGAALVLAGIALGQRRPGRAVQTRGLRVGEDIGRDDPNPFGVADHVDLHDPAGPHGEGHHGQRPALDRDDHAGGAVDHRGVQHRARDAAGLLSDLLPAAQGLGAGPAGAEVGAQHDVRVEQLDERVEVTALGGAEERVDHLPLTGEVAVRRGDLRSTDPSAGPAGELSRRSR